MKRILFVDDEQLMLDALRDRLRKQRGQWDMVFALGGQEALAELERGPFDVVVSDMRMPGSTASRCFTGSRISTPRPRGSFSPVMLSVTRWSTCCG
jgi:CheY-like chemotaxis protein